MVPARLFFACNRAPAPTGLSSAAAEHNIQLRRMAEAEPIAAIRAELLAVARQYQQLADGLRTGAAFSTEGETDANRTRAKALVTVLLAGSRLKLEGRHPQ